MAKNKNRNYQQSQRPGFQQASTRPAATGEAALDNQRIPSPATAAQSQADAERSDPDRYVPRDDQTVTDAAPGESTDLISGDDKTMNDVDEEIVDHVDEAEAQRSSIAEGEEIPPFTGFDEPEQRGHATGPLLLDAAAQKRKVNDDELVPVMPRRTVMRTKIGPAWYNFIKGQEQFVPNYVREHLVEKGVI
jgi:hypothetical protein